MAKKKDIKLHHSRKPKYDLTDQYFGYLHVLEYCGGSQWKCKCKCDKITYVDTQNLLNGITQSCGCKHREIVKQKQRNSVDLSGKTIGAFTVISYHHSGENKNVYWNCRCNVCGNECITTTHKIKTNKSCGCLEKKALEIGQDLCRYSHQEGTCLYQIKDLKEYTTSTTGKRGVSYNKRSCKYTARITFKNKRFWLGSYPTFDEAKQARELAEHNIFGDFLEWYKTEHPDIWERINRNK
ncbi:AP2/ERF family transcription factor [Blautia producta]|uniref:AP2/ERF family transcription factor n=1 Tax=Blautia producta TaxID=33035 RepID=UPI0031B5C30F